MQLGNGAEGLAPCGDDDSLPPYPTVQTGSVSEGTLGVCLPWQDLSFIPSLVSIHTDSEVHPPTGTPG